MTADQVGRQQGALPWCPGDRAGILVVPVWTAARPESGGASPGLPGAREQGACEQLGQDALTASLSPDEQEPASHRLPRSEEMEAS